MGTLPRLQAIVSSEWLEPITALETEICPFDFQSALAPAQRVVLFWDAHGFEVAGTVLGKIMPALAAKPHLVIMHDLCDTRYLGEQSRFYGDQPLWTGNNWSGPRVRLGQVESTVEQAIAALDFTSRNRIELHSADHSLHTDLTHSQKTELQQMLAELYSLNGFWFYFSLNEGEPPFTFPLCPVVPPPVAVQPALAAVGAEPSAPALQAVPPRRGWLARTTARWQRSLAKRLKKTVKNTEESA